MASGEYIDFYIDPETLDYVYDPNTGKFRMLETTAEACRQRVYTRLSTWLGEWIFDTSFGVDYKGAVIRQGVTQTELDAIFLDTIYDEDLVESVDSYSSDFDSSERTYSFTAKILVSENSEIVNEVELLPSKEWTYSFYENTITATCVTETIEAANKLYIYVNATLPLAKNWTLEWN